jgi:hypothetical protein
MTTGGISTPGDYIINVVEDRVNQAGMRLTDDARDHLRTIVEAGIRRDYHATENGADQLAERIVVGAVRIARLTEGDQLDAEALRSIQRWFCPMSPWC